MGRSSPLVQLYLTRIREFYRQPARIFWVYGFPILLAIVLGLAFKNRASRRRSRPTWSTGRAPGPSKQPSAHTMPG